MLRGTLNAVTVVSDGYTNGWTKLFVEVVQTLKKIWLKEELSLVASPSSILFLLRDTHICIKQGRFLPKNIESLMPLCVIQSSLAKSVYFLMLLCICELIQAYTIMMKRSSGDPHPAVIHRNYFNLLL